MKQKTGKTLKKNIANFFGSFGYLLCCLQWFWAIMLYFSVVQSAILLVAPNPDTQVEHSSGFTFTLPSSLEVIILTIIVTVMIVITIYVLIKLPMGMVKTSNKIVRSSAETLTPIVIKAQHKKDTKKIRIKITSKLTLAIKALLIIVPLALAATSGLLEKQAINYPIALIVGGGLACLGVIFFAMQYLLARLLRVKISYLW